MKKVFSVIICLLLICTLAASASANTTSQYIWDEAGLLSTYEESSLSQTASILVSKYGMDMVIVTTNSTNGKSPQAYAEDFYDSTGYADDGILLLLSMEERDWYICTTGLAMEIFTENGIDRMGDEMIPHLSDGDYYTGFVTFLNLIPDYFDAYHNGTPVGEEFDPSVILISLGIGLLVALITVWVMRSSMNTAKQCHSATEYVKNGTFDLHLQQDFFLYSRVSKTAKSNNSSGGRSGGGGRSHGGGGGKF
jgi:uncharacterized protein